MISVAIATYNGSKYIHEFLLSIYEQSVPADEVIISDDCSTDNTVEVVRTFIDTNKLYNWKLFVNSKNTGFSNNFFSAIKKTNGDIIFIADQDDIWDKSKIEVMSELFKEKKAAAAASGSIYIDSEGKPINIVLNIHRKSKYKSPAVKKIPLNSLIGKSLYPGCTMSIGKKMRDFLKNQGAPSLNNSLGHDWYCSIVASILGNFYYIDKPLICRRIHEANASLGRLRKKRILSSSNEKRNISFEEIIRAHQFVLNNPELRNYLSVQDKRKLCIIIRFFKTRLRFTTSKNIFAWLALHFYLRQYYHIGNGFRGAMHFYIADLFYALGINWKIKNPGLKI